MIPISQIDPELSIYKENTVVIWGAGQYGRELLKLLQNFQIKVACFCDSNTKLWKQEIDGVPIILPQELMKMQFEYNAQENSGVGQIIVQLAMMPQYEAQARPQVEAMGIEKMICYEEAKTILSHYIKCQRFQEVPSLLAKKSTFGYAYRRGICNELYQYYLNHWDNLGIFVCMIGKTGDVTLVKTLNQSGLPCFQNHYPPMFNQDIIGNKKIKIVTAVREPIIRSVSSLYQMFVDMGKYIPRFDVIYQETQNDSQFFFDELWNTQTTPKEVLRSRFNLTTVTSDEDMNGLSDLGLWFSSFKENVSDLLKFPFDKEAGYSIVQDGNYDIFIYQLEKLDDIVPQLSHWADTPFTELANGNITDNKWISKSYKQAQKELKFSQEYFDACYNDPYVKHFYSEADIEKFKDRWRGNIDPNK